MVQSWIALACLLAGADAFGPMPHHTHEEPDTHEVPHHTHESESPSKTPEASPSKEPEAPSPTLPPSASPSPPPSAPEVIVPAPKFSVHQGWFEGQCDYNIPEQSAISNINSTNTEGVGQCWDKCEAKFLLLSAFGISSHKLDLELKDIVDGEEEFELKCTCRKGCTCWKDAPAEAQAGGTREIGYKEAVTLAAPKYVTPADKTGCPLP